MKIQNRSHTKSHRTSLCTRLKEFMTLRSSFSAVVDDDCCHLRVKQTNDYSIRDLVSFFKNTVE